MKKINALMLALLGSLGIISSVALVARYFSKPVETTTKYGRADRYATTEMPAVEKISLTYEELKSMGLEDEAIRYKLIEEEGLTAEQFEDYKETGELPAGFSVTWEMFKI